MSKIVIIGAGAMGSAFAVPCLDNNHNINIVGTHLENDFIESLKKNANLHPGLKIQIPKQIKIFKFEKFTELLNSNVDLIVLGISSKGIESVTTVLPPSSILDQFNELVTPLFLMWINNSKKNTIFSDLRSTLLPKLLSGEFETTD